jgi:polyribonucleotide nucleotidyltransferase
MMQRVEKTFAGRKLVIETGRMAKQASGSAVVQFGDTMVLAAVTVSDTQSPLSFFPLLVEYREKTYAAGKIPGGFIKREGRPRARRRVVRAERVEDSVHDADRRRARGPHPGKVGAQSHLPAARL